MSSAGTAPISVFLKSRAEVRLGAHLGGGGEGNVFEVSTDPTKVIKLYRKPTDEQRRKLEAMLKAVPDDPQRAKRNHVSICWPEEIVYASDGSMAGFLMPRLDTNTYKPAALFWNPEDRALYFPGFSWKYLCVAAANAASVVDLIHQKGHAVGDMNDENLLVNDRALVTLVDCDSMQVRDPGSAAVFRCTVAREAYIAPELLSKDLSAFDRNFAQDYWALSVLVFQMLMEGQHPTNGIGDPEERMERIRRGIFPFLGAPGFGIPQYAIPLSIVPTELQRLFRRCFNDGHAHPELRPTAAEWRSELQRAAGSLVQCSEVEVHWYSPHLNGCPWCQEKKMVGLDRFSLAIGHFQTALPPTPFSAPPTQPVNPSAPVTPPAQTSSSGWGGFLAVAVLALLFIFGFIIKSNSDRANAEAAERRRVQEAQAQAETQRRDEARKAADAAEAERKRAEELARILAGQTWVQQATPSFGVSYPADWSLNRAPQNPNFIQLFMTSAVRRKADGQPWFEYDVSAGYFAGSQTLEAFTAWYVQVSAADAPGIRKGAEAPLQTQFGRALGSDLYYDCPFNYVETRRLLSIQRPGGVFMIQFSAPNDQYARMQPLFERILNSITFY